MALEIRYCFEFRNVIIDKPPTSLHHCEAFQLKVNSLSESFSIFKPVLMTEKKLVSKKLFSSLSVQNK